MSVRELANNLAARLIDGLVASLAATIAGIVIAFDRPDIPCSPYTGEYFFSLRANLGPHAYGHPPIKRAA
jgi:hypothetical protein